jgi:hypothetical protein
MSKEKKITALDWFIEQINEIYYLTEDAIVIFEKAKAMEREQIIDAFNQSWHDRMNPYKTADKYYNETFKSE